MSTLHLVAASPAAGSALTDALRTAAPGDAVLLLQDGVYAAAEGAAWNALLAAASMRQVQLHVLRDDAQARGLGTRLHTLVTTVDDDGFVALTERHARVVSWW